MNPERGYIFSAVIPAFCAIISSIIYGWNDYDPNYASEWLTPDSSFVFSIVPSVINGLFICLLSFPILLNRLKGIRNRFVWSALSWLTFPGIWICYLLIRDHGIFIVINTLPYLIGMSITFGLFRKRVATGERPPLDIITKENRKTQNGSNVDNSIWG